MSSVESKLKLEVINRITELDDIRIIQEIKNLIDFEMDEGVFELSQEQKNRLIKAKDEVVKGETFTNEEVNDEIAQWLNEK